MSRQSLRKLCQNLPHELLHSCLKLSFRQLHSTPVRAADATKPFYVTTPIFYVNAEPHIGHLHSLVLADVLKRYRRLRDGLSRGQPVLLTGTDEHGMKIQKVAQSRGIAPIELCDQVSVRFKALAEAAGCSYDIFFRTIQEDHARTVQHVWKSLQEGDYIYKAHYEGWYSVSDEAYYSENQTREEQNQDGTITRIALESRQPVEWMQEENYMFRLSAFQDRLLAWLKAHQEAVQPRVRYNEVMSYLTSAPLGDLSISRPRSRLDWGIQVPDDPSHTIYVWIDALTNYLTASGYPIPNDPNIWPADVHVVGKDIIRFHAVYWPAMLMALELPLPKTVLAHAHWTMGQFKMSKSRGNVVDPFGAIDRFSKDGIRYFLMSKGGLESDSDFSEENVARDYRKDLAGQAGNMVMRLQSNGIQAKMQQALQAKQPAGLTQYSQTLQANLEALPGLVDQAMQRFEPSKALDAIFTSLAEVNAHFAFEEPWKVADPATLAAILPLSLEGLRKIALLLQPFIPDSAQALLDRLGVSSVEREWDHVTAWHGRRSMERLVDYVKANGRQTGVFMALQDDDRKHRNDSPPVNRKPRKSSS